jgi:diguanylate cyclase (GGDEF)-like protein
MQQLAQDLRRAKRSGESFILGFVDLDGLKTTNDVLGHAAGDRLLVRVVATMRAHLRSHDLIVRFGGDEFLCGMKDISTEEAATLFARVQADLSASKGSVTVGLAELAEQDSLDDLVMRANATMHAKRKQHHHRRSTR